MLYDVIIVGAGPAGSTTARECADRGLSVLLIERTEFPRDKPCGGGITVRAAKLLPFEITSVVERPIFGIHLSLHGTRGFTRRSPEPLVYMTERSRFDNLLLERALETGVTVLMRTTVREVQRYRDHVVVRTNSGVVKGITLVAADGANGQTAKLAGMAVRFSLGVAMEGNLTPPRGVPVQWRDVLSLDVGGKSGGYGWLFPKGDRINFGVSGWKQEGPALRSKLRRLIEFHGFNAANLKHLTAHYMPIRQRDSLIAHENVLAVGDAAGLLDPLTGEGIYAAIWSGHAAAVHLAEYVSGSVADLSGYHAQVESELIPDLRVARQFHDLFHLCPAAFVAIARWTPFLWQFTQGLVRGDHTYVDVMRRRRVIRPIVQFGSDLVRVTPFLQQLAGLRDPAPPERFFRRSAQHR